MTNDAWSLSCFFYYFLSIFFIFHSSFFYYLNFIFFFLCLSNILIQIFSEDVIFFALLIFPLIDFKPFLSVLPLSIQFSPTSNTFYPPFIEYCLFSFCHLPFIHFIFSFLEYFTFAMIAFLSNTPLLENYISIEIHHKIE